MVFCSPIRLVLGRSGGKGPMIQKKKGHEPLQNSSQWRPHSSAHNLRLLSVDVGRLWDIVGRCLMFKAAWESAVRKKAWDLDLWITESPLGAVPCNVSRFYLGNWKLARDNRALGALREFCGTVVPGSVGECLLA